MLVHPIHVSVCDISTSSDGQIDLSFKIFYDDLQTAMGLEPGEGLPKKYKGANQLIETFINQNFTLKINGKKATLKYVDSFSNPPAVWTEMTVAGVKANDIKSLEITNTIMNGLFTDQTNLVNLDINNKKEMVKLDRKSTTFNLKF